MAEVGLGGSGVSASFLKDTQVVPLIRVVRPQFEALLLLLNGFAQLAGRRQFLRKQRAKIGIIGCKFHSCPQLSDCLGGAARLGIGHGQVFAGIRIMAVRPDRAAQFDDGGVGLPRL